MYSLCRCWFRLILWFLSCLMYFTCIYFFSWNQQFLFSLLPDISNHSHGVYSLYRHPCPSLGLQKVPGANYLSIHCTFYKYILEQKACHWGEWHKWPKTRWKWYLQGKSIISQLVIIYTFYCISINANAVKLFVFQSENNGDVTANGATLTADKKTDWQHQFCISYLTYCKYSSDGIKNLNIR